MRLQDFMRRPVRTIARGATLAEARELMALYRVRHLVVLEGSLVVGVLSERDLGGPRGAGQLKGTVEERMARDPVSATPRTTAREAANLLRGLRIGCLPVLDRGHLAGIVTVTDLLDLIGRGIVAPSPERRRATLARRKPLGREQLPRADRRVGRSAGR